MAAAAVLTAVEWHQLNRLLEKALELDPPQRATWVEQQTDLKPELASALRELLEEAAADDDEFASPFAAQHQTGELIGPYRLVRELAQGGMGVVWVAERADGSFERQVALKLPRPEWAAPGLAERMARERAILASLNHPNIAQLYDAGWTSDGRPFLALELVEGVPIDSYIATHGLGSKERLTLFVDVARAVAFAHTRLIVHRDLKPANVLVTADGSVKLLDFGISKLTKGEASGAATALTQASGRALTLAYAAPEQVLGQPVSPATDVYALGVMLYELLTGSRPYRPKHDSRLALEEAVLHAEPLPPSRAVANQNARELRGDLDTVVLKALKKAPAQRYAAASDFAEDLEAFLARHPVKARPDSTFYRAQMFVRRNRLALGVTSALAAALLIGGGVALWQAQATRAEAQRADAIKDFVLAMIRQADPLAGAVQREADDALLSIAEDRISSGLESRPRMAMELRLTIAEAYRNRGFYDRAQNVLRVAMREGRRSLADDDPLMTQARIKMAYAPLIVEADGQAELERAIEHARRMGPAGMEFLVEGLMRHSYLLVAVEPERSLNELKEANDLARRHLGLEHPLTLEVAVNLSPRARSPEVLQQTYEAARANPKIPASHPMLLKAQATLGAQLVSAGRKEEGLELTAEAVEASKRHHGDQGKITEENMLVLATVQFALGRPREGLDTLREALRMASLREPITSPNRGNIAMRIVASSLTHRQLEGLGPFIATNLDHEFVGEPKSTERNKTIRDFLKGWFTLESGSTRDAEDQLSAAVREMERLNMTAWASPSRIQWARAVLENGRPADALAILGESKSPLRVIAVTAAELARGQPDAVVRIGDDALKRGPEDYMFPAAADFHVVRARALLALRRPGEALPHFAKAHSYWQGFDPASPWAAEASYWYGRGLTAAGDSRQGRVLIAEALPALRKSQMPSHRALAAQSSR